MTRFGTTPLRGETLLLVNGRIHPRAYERMYAEAMLVVDGRVEALGTADELRARAPERVRELDLAGRDVLPGLIDAHTHVEESAISRNAWVDVRGVSVEEACARIADAVSRAGEGEWVRAQGTFLQPLPTREQLDAVAPSTPVIMRESAHRLQANSTALAIAGLSDAAPEAAAGVVIHVDEHGRPTGLVEEAMHMFPVPPIPDDVLESYFVRELSESFARRGITTIFEIPMSWQSIGLYLKLAEEGRLPARLTLTPIVGPGIRPTLDRVQDWDASRIGDQVDSDLIAAGGLKIFIDGDNEQMFDTKFFDAQPRQWGAVTRTLGDLREELVWAIKADVQVLIHAIGDLAQEMVLEAVAQAQARAGRPSLPIRLEHAANLQLHPHILERMIELDVIPVPTASFIATDDGVGVYSYRTLIDAGTRPPGNSDTAGAIALAPSPWFGIAMMVDRLNLAGEPITPEEAVTVEEALQVYTDFAAEAGGLDGVIGALEPGFAADFAVYETDPRDLPTDQMRLVETDITAVGGRITWQKG